MPSSRHTSQNASSSGSENPVPFGNWSNATDCRPSACELFSSETASSTFVIGVTELPMSRSGATEQ